VARQTTLSIRCRAGGASSRLQVKGNRGRQAAVMGSWLAEFVQRRLHSSSHSQPEYSEMYRAKLSSTLALSTRGSPLGTRSIGILAPGPVRELLPRILSPTLLHSTPLSAFQRCEIELRHCSRRRLPLTALTICASTHRFTVTQTYVTCLGAITDA
jgi:hypothetical protein